MRERQTPRWHTVCSRVFGGPEKGHKRQANIVIGVSSFAGPVVFGKVQGVDWVALPLSTTPEEPRYVIHIGLFDVAGRFGPFTKERSTSATERQGVGGFWGFPSRWRAVVKSIQCVGGSGAQGCKAGSWRSASKIEVKAAWTTSEHGRIGHANSSVIATSHE